MYPHTRNQSSRRSRLRVAPRLHLSDDEELELYLAHRDDANTYREDTYGDDHYFEKDDQYDEDYGPSTEST